MLTHGYNYRNMQSRGCPLQHCQTLWLYAAGEIRLAKYPEAVALLMRFGAACDRLGLRPCKAYLSAVITWLYAQDGAQALSTLQVRIIMKHTRDLLGNAKVGCREGQGVSPAALPC